MGLTASYCADMGWNCIMRHSFGVFVYAMYGIAMVISDIR